MDTKLKAIFVLTFLLQFYNPWETFAQGSLTVSIPNFSNQQIYLYKIRGEKRFLLDSLQTDNQGKINYHFSTKVSSGMFLIMNTQGKSVKFIYNQEDVNFILNDFEDKSSIYFDKMSENALWFDYTMLDDETHRKLGLIIPVLNSYPPDSKYFKHSQKEYITLQSKMLQFIKKNTKKKPNSYATKLIRTDFEPIPPIELNADEKRNYVMNHFLDSINFADTLLLNSDILTRKMIDYLALQQQNDQNINEMQKKFILALDQILIRASKEEKMYTFILAFFLEGFTQMGLTTVTNYLIEVPHFKADCITAESMIQIEKIVEPFRKIMIGAIAPMIISTDITGNTFNINEISNTQTIIVFWSIHCPFCMEMIPKLKEIQNKYPEIQIISIIIGKHQEEVNQFIEKENLNWIHLNDGLIWESPVVKAYKVYGTPTLYLLDENHIITARPNSIVELIDILNS